MAAQSPPIKRLLLAAALIDLMVLAMAVYAIDVAALSGTRLSVPAGLDVVEQRMLLRLATIVMLVMAYQIVTELAFNGWTIGKSVLALRAVTDRGRAPRFGARLIRLIVRLFGFALVSPRREGLPVQDYLVGVRYESPLLRSAGQDAADPDAAAPHDWVLAVRVGDGRASARRLSAFGSFQRRGVLRIGRDPKWAGLTISDTRVTRRHAELRLRGGRLELRDVGSSNGTWLNGERLRPDAPQRLKDGENTIVLGRIATLVIRPD